MELKVGEEMERHIDFFKKTFLFFWVLFFLSCSGRKEKITVNEYYNFFNNTTKIKDTIQYESEINLDDKSNNAISYIAKIVKNDNGDKVINSNFVYIGKEFKTPISFKNFKEYDFKYSLMPTYSEKNLVAKKFNSKNVSALIIRGENPFCNGNNCQSYYVHLIILKDDTIKSNFVYHFNSSDEIFEDFSISFDKDILLLSNKKVSIDKIKYN